MADLFFTGWRRWGAMIALVIVLAVPATLAAKAWHDANNNPVIKIKISGFDPRDLLRGHYMLFRFEWNMDEEQTPACSGAECCLCLTNEPVNPPAHVMPCSVAQRPVCPIQLRGAHQGGDWYDIGLSRYYVPEVRARELETLLREDPDNFLMGISLRPNGTAVLEKLYYKDMSVEDYLRAHPVAAEPAPLADPAMTPEAAPAPVE